VVAPNSGGVVYVTSGGGGAGPYYTAPNNLISASVGVNNYVHAEVAGEELVLRVQALQQTAAIDSIVLRPQPQILSAVNSASLTTDLASGSALTVLGRNLSPISVSAAMQASSGKLSALGLSATLNGVPVPILSADAGQMNLQVPFNVFGTATLAVITKNGTSQTTIEVSAVAPQFFMNADGSVMAIHADGSPVTSASPARSSETITLLLTGLGAVNQNVNVGALPPPGVGALASVGVKIGGIVAPSQPAVLSTASPGAYQLRVQVPAGLTSSGTVAVQATANSVASNTPFLPVSA
jgi:uncharacterized protein (TIGR03437 family)